MTTTQKELFEALTAALFKKTALRALSDDAIDEAKTQAVLSLVSKNKQAMQIIIKNMQIAWQQQQLVGLLTGAGIPFIVLKGLAAAMYYPDPILRALGDIDILIAPEDFSRAYDLMASEGYSTHDPREGNERHVHFKKDGITIELHRRYAELNTAAAEKLLDGWLFEAISHAVTGSVVEFSFPRAPEPLNGLILLTHINHHLEGGLGIRQLVDWVMYTARELRDENWPAFQNLTDQLGLTRLAKFTARYGQLYLGLPEEGYTWCRDIDDAVCADLAEYIFECGNFGTKDRMSNTVTMVLSHGSGMKGFLRNLQQRGEHNWKAYQKYRWLKPLCWLYQGVRYAHFGLRRDSSLVNLKKDYLSSKKRNKLMTALGAERYVERNRQ